MDGVSYSHIFAPALRSSLSPHPSPASAERLAPASATAEAKAKPQPRTSPSPEQAQAQTPSNGTAAKFGDLHNHRPLHLPASSLLVTHIASAILVQKRPFHIPSGEHSAAAHIGPHSSIPKVVCGSLYCPQTAPRHHALPALDARGAATAFHPAVIRCCAASVRVQLHWQLVPKAEQFRDAASRRTVQVGPREPVGPRTWSDKRQRGHGQWIKCSHAI